MTKTIVRAFAFLVLAACAGDHDDGAVNLAPPPEDKSGFTYIEPGGFKINYNREFVEADDVNLGDTDIVLGVSLDGEARAYPVNLMTGPVNEVVNDHLGKSNIAVTWCSVDYSGVVYRRDIDGRPFHFGVMGMENGAMILYDRQTRSRWNQLFGKATSGDMQGQRLEKVPSTVTTWKQWLARHPETTVYINRRVPYQPQFTSATIRELARKPASATLGATDLVLALEGHVKAKAYPLSRLAEARVVNDLFENVPIVVVITDDLATAKIYDRRVDDRALTFGRGWLSGALTDDQTGTEWDPLTGKALGGNLAGKALKPIPATYVLWYAWKGYRPDTAIHGDS